MIIKNNIFLLFIIFIYLFFIPLSSYSQSIEWYYTWNNRLDKLEIDSERSIPLLLNGTNFRILKVDDLNGSITEISARASNASVKIFALPEMEDYNGNAILDVMIPLISNRIPLKTKYFLLKIKGNISGVSSLTLNVKVNNKSFSLNKEILISRDSYQKKLSMNNWSYFDYSYLVRGIKKVIVHDLVDHQANSLDIPPYNFPAVMDPNNAQRIDKMKKYLQYTQNKFDYYMLFMGYTSKDDYVLSDSWKKNISTWYNTVISIFNAMGIDKSKVLLFPYDEPKGISIRKLSGIYDFFRQQGIPNDFFVTVGTEDAALLAKKIEYVQVYSGNDKVINEVNRNKLTRTKVWIYEIPAGSRNYNANFYHKIGFKAYKYNASGIGVWNYADADNSMNDKNLKDFSEGKPSWLIKASNPVRDYSLIYRHREKIYSSIRWEALAFCMEEYNWLGHYEAKYGHMRCIELINKIISNKMSQNQWEKVKFSMIQK